MGDRGRDRGTRRHSVVDPRHLGVCPNAPRASVPDDVALVAEHHFRPVGAVEDRLSVDVLAGHWDLDDRPLADHTDGARRWQR